MAAINAFRPEEISRLGAEIYDRAVAPAIGPEDVDKFVAIDIRSGVYELDRDDFAATERLLQREPCAQIWLARVCQKTAYRIGGWGSGGKR